MTVGELPVIVDARLGHLVRMYQLIAERIGIEIAFDIPVRTLAGENGPFSLDFTYDHPTWSTESDGESPDHTGYALRAAEAMLARELEFQAGVIAEREAAGEPEPRNLCPTCGRCEVVLRFEPPRLVMRCPRGDWEEDWTPAAP